jgi:hypothetical protein
MEDEGIYPEHFNKAMEWEVAYTTVQKKEPEKKKRKGKKKPHLEDWQKRSSEVKDQNILLERRTSPRASRREWHSSEMGFNISTNSGEREYVYIYIYTEYLCI